MELLDGIFVDLITRPSEARRLSPNRQRHERLHLAFFSLLAVARRLRLNRLFGLHLKHTADNAGRQALLLLQLAAVPIPEVEEADVVVSSLPPRSAAEATPIAAGSGGKEGKRRERIRPSPPYTLLSSAISSSISDPSPASDPPPYFCKKKKKKSNGIRPTSTVMTITATFASTFRSIAADKAKGDSNSVESELLLPYYSEWLSREISPRRDDVCVAMERGRLPSPPREARVVEAGNWHSW
ncbi:hypothetical protein MUK42_21576 [Musa troglodytarum]|uniref:Uncharacterized protein n=1 Tax=Musa troglodytarum TaxID=320322 RepID=A0A9E7KCD6_9LILI|nr:hypothetical protein MUK42_21576 [Musa troglodytarum]